ncbi:MAG: class B sortase [Clostridiales bacterium]|nr:class B sortase [Clostridiales bacterium]
MKTKVFYTLSAVFFISAVVLAIFYIKFNFTKPVTKDDIEQGVIDEEAVIKERIESALDVISSSDNPEENGFEPVTEKGGEILTRIFTDENGQQNFEIVTRVAQNEIITQKAELTPERLQSLPSTGKSKNPRVESPSNKNKSATPEPVREKTTADYSFPASAGQTSGSQSSGVVSGYNSPVDFEQLRRSAPDVIAWLDIPNTEVSYPVVMRKGNSSYYLFRNIYGKTSKYGSLFVEDCNNSDFSDNVTVIYGHNVTSGAMFGSLKDYYTGSSTDSHKTISVYLPDRKLTYKTVAAVPADNDHLIKTALVNTEAGFNGFIKSIYSTRSLSAFLDMESRPVYGDRLLILSTCVSDDTSKRYLVIAKKV